MQAVIGQEKFLDRCTALLPIALSQGTKHWRSSVQKCQSKVLYTRKFDARFNLADLVV